MSRVNADTAYGKVGTTYAQGCSGFVCDLLGKDWKSADDFAKGSKIGANGNYSGVSAGDIVGFAGHVAVYVGKPDAKFVDVNGAKGAVRKVNSYGETAVYKASY